MGESMSDTPRIREIEQEFRARLEAAADLKALDDVRVAFLGKKGAVTLLYKELGKVDAAFRAEAGRLINDLRTAVEGALEAKAGAARAADLTARLEAERVDVTLPGRGPAPGRLHPLTLVERRIVSIFEGLGYDVALGPEIECDFCNFAALNFPPHHPARDSQDTFFFADDVLLRTHTSPVQVRTMLAHEPPIRIVAPGAVYRADPVDASHSPAFHQVEGLVVDEGITFADLKGTLAFFAGRMFGEGTEVVFRPSFFPFVEPGAEVDVSCPVCRRSGAACPACKGTGYMEIMGAGMVHPNVLSACGIDPARYSGFAFGMGTERVAMITYGIKDIRLFYENDVRFLHQFGAVI